MLTSKKVLGILNKKLADVGGGTTPETAVPVFYLVEGTQIYDVYVEDGVLKCTEHDPGEKVLDHIIAFKVKTEYSVGDLLNVDDLTVTAYYDDETHDVVTEYTTNASTIDMDTQGTKELVITYTEDGVTKTDTVEIEVGEIAKFVQGFRDITIIPDKYNTGLTTELSELTPYDASTDTSGILWRDWSGNHGWDGNKSVFANCTQADILYENTDFTGVNLNTINWKANGENTASTTMAFDEMTITFKNCLLNSANLAGFTDTTNSHKVKVIYDHCMMQAAMGGNAEYNNCLIGNRSWYLDNGYNVVTGDISNVRDNATFNSSYFCDAMVRTDTQGTEHIDAWQGAATFTNLTFNNTRFEVPYMSYTTHSGGVNTLIFAEASGSNLLVKDCILNGGGQNMISAESDVTNGVFDNVLVGEGSIAGGIFYPGTQEHLTSVDVDALDTAYVSSVFKSASKIHVIVSNDLIDDIELTYKTNLSTGPIEIDANYRGQSMSADTDFEDLPIDIDFTIDEDAEYVVIHDGETQIRFVDFTEDHRHTKVIPTPDATVIPDKYNTGAHGTLTEFELATDTSGLNWRDKTYTNLSIDFNNGSGFKNLTEAKKDIVFENIDFVSNYMYLDFLNRGNYKPESAYRKDFQITFTFKNCKFGIVNTRSANPTDDLAPTISFENCTFVRFGGGDVTLTNCRVGDYESYFEDTELRDAYFSHTFNGDPVNPKSNFTMTNSYIMDCEDNWLDKGQSGLAHIDGMQFTTLGTIYDNIHIENCRFECPSMPWTYTQGGYNVAMFLQGTLTNSEVNNVLINGGGYYEISGTGSDSLKYTNVKIGNNYGAARNTYPYGGEALPMTGMHADTFEELDITWQEHPIVSSIFYDGDDTKVVYSNDTDESKTLTIKTSDGDTYTQTVEAMPMGEALITKDNTAKFSDYPIDRVYTITGKKPEWVQVYDGTTLIRTAVLA